MPRRVCRHCELHRARAAEVDMTWSSKEVNGRVVTRVTEIGQAPGSVVVKGERLK